MTTRFDGAFLVCAFAALCMSCNGELNDRADDTETGLTGLTARVAALESRNAALSAQATALQSSLQAARSAADASSANLSQRLDDSESATTAALDTLDGRLQQINSESRFLFDGGGRILGRVESVSDVGFTYIDPDLGLPVFTRTAGVGTSYYYYTGANCTGAIYTAATMDKPAYGWFMPKEGQVFTIATTPTTATFLTTRDSFPTAPCLNTPGSNSSQLMTAVKTYAPYDSDIAFLPAAY